MVMYAPHASAAAGAAQSLRAAAETARREGPAAPGGGRSSRRTVVWRGGAGAAGLLAAACGAPGSAGLSGAGGAPAAGVKPGTTLRLYDGASGTLVTPYAETLAQFTAKTGIKVESDPPISGKWNEQLLTQVSAGTAPDVSVGYGDELFSFIDNDAAVDVTARIAKDVTKADVDDWLPSQYGMFRRNGKQYALPKYCGTSCFYGNLELYKQAGVALSDDKTTWTQFRDRLVTLTKTEGGRITQFGLDTGTGHLGYVLAWMVWSWGGEVTDPKDDAKCLLDQPAALEALQFAQDLIWKHHVAPRPDEVTALGPGRLFSRSLAATNRNGSWLITPWQQDNPELRWDAFANPLGPTGKRFTFHTTDAYLMFKSTASQAPDAAWQLLRFVSGTDWGRMLIRERQLQPARRSLGPEWVKTSKEKAPAAKDANLDVFIKAFDYARPQHSFSNNPKAYEILTPVLDSVFNKNEVSATQAFKEAAPKVTALLQSLKK